MYLFRQDREYFWENKIKEKLEDKFEHFSSGHCARLRGIHSVLSMYLGYVGTILMFYGVAEISAKRENVHRERQHSSS